MIRSYGSLCKEYERLKTMSMWGTDSSSSTVPANERKTIKSSIVVCLLIVFTRGNWAEGGTCR